MASCVPHCTVHGVVAVQESAAAGFQEAEETTGNCSTAVCYDCMEFN